MRPFNQVQDFKGKITVLKTAEGLLGDGAGLSLYSARVLAVQQVRPEIFLL
jgi:hypothetical protein